jgi:hypothetical protein
MQLRPIIYCLIAATFSFRVATWELKAIKYQYVATSDGLTFVVISGYDPSKCQKAETNTFCVYESDSNYGNLTLYRLKQLIKSEHIKPYKYSYQYHW